MPAEIAARWRASRGAVRATPLARWTAADPYLALLVHRAVLDAQAAVDDADRDGLRIALERLGHALAALGEAEEVGDERTPKELARWLAAAVEVPQRDLAALLGVDLRRFQRWISPREGTRPEGEEARRLRAVARLVGQLRHAYTAAGRAGVVRPPAARARRRGAARAARRPAAPARPDARRGLGAQHRVRVIVTAFRLASWRRPLRTEPSRVPGRFHRAAEPSPTQYACLHPARSLGGADPRGGAAHRGRAGARAPPHVGAARSSSTACRGSASGRRPAHGLRPGDLVSDDLRACQRLADRLRAAGAPGAIVPSAALPGTDNLVLFGERAAAPYGVDPLSPVDVPAAITADRARPPLGLLGRVRLRGAPHAALEAWRAASRSGSSSRRREAVRRGEPRCGALACT